MQPTVIKRTSAMLAVYEGNLAQGSTTLSRSSSARSARHGGASTHCSVADGPVRRRRCGRTSAADRRPVPSQLLAAYNADQFLRNHKLSAVDAELSRFVELHPRDAWARREAAIVAMGHHQLDRAWQEIQLALELDPINENAHCIVGRVHELRGELTLARSAYRRALELNIDCDLAVSNLIGTCDRPVERNAELAFILQQLRQQTTYGDGIIAYRDAANGRMEPAKLLEQLEEARTYRPDLWQAWTVVIHQHLEMNQGARALALAKEATERFPMIPRYVADLALSHRHADDHDAELAALQRARSINPHWLDVARALSELYMSRNQYDDAEQVVRQVLASDPRDPISLAALADCLYRADKKQAALDRWPARALPRQVLIGAGRICATGPANWIRARRLAKLPTELSH